MTTPLDKVPSGVDRGLSRWLSQVRDAVTSLQKATAGSKIVATKRNITVPAPVLLSVVRTYKSQSTIPPQDQSDAQNQPIVCDLTFSEAPYTIQIARGITTTVPGNAPIMGTTNSLYFEDSNSPGPDAAYFVRYISTPWGNTAWTGPFPITVDAAPDGKVVTGTPPSVDDAVGWEPNTNYDQNTIIVTPAPNSYAQVVTTPGKSGATAPTWNNTPGGTTTDGTVTWTNAGYVTYSQILTSHTLANVAFNYRGAWNSGASFLAGDEVVYGPTYWLAVVPNSNSVPSTSNANWVAMGSYSGFEGFWNSISTFAPGAEVIYGGAYWISLVANTNSPPSVSNPNWQVAGIVGSSASFNVTAVGWYEVALSDNSQYADYRCGFSVDASVFSGGTQGTCTFKVTSDSTGAQAALTQLHGAPGTAITQARVRIDGANHTALDVYVNWGSGTLNLAVTVTPIQGAWNSAAAQGGLAATAGTVKQTVNLDPAGTGGNGGGWAHIGPGGKFHLMLDGGDVYHGGAHVFNGTQQFMPGLDYVLDTPSGLYQRWKASQQIALLANPSQGHVVDPKFTSVADFWNNVGSANNGVFTLPAMTANQGFGPSAYNRDGRGNVRQIKVQPGDVVVMQITCVTAATGTVATSWVAMFVNSAGSDLGVYPSVTAGAAGVTTVGTAVPAPANAVGMQIYFQGNSGVSGGNNASVSNPVVRINQETLIDKGSTIQLGDPRNGRALFTAGVQYYLSGMALTNPSSGKINCAAGTLLMGGSGSGNVAYNASSVTGLTNGQLYYCYYLDPGFTGGSKTLNATTTKTDLSNSPDTVYLGYCTPQAAGGGGGGAGGCVYAEAWLDTADGSAVQAKDATQGLLLNAQLDDGTLTQLPILNVPYVVNEPCVQLTTAEGSLILSDMTPVNCAKGPFPAFDTVGETVTVRQGGATKTGVVTAAPFVGACPVVRISLGGASFGAGQLPNGYFLYTHNTLKP